MTTHPPEFEEELARRLGGGSRIAVVGIGDELQPTDRLGMVAAKEVEALRLPGVGVHLAGTLPESYTAPIRRSRPDRVVLLDAAEMGMRPGTVAILSTGQVRGARLSTHALPLTVLIEYLEKTMDVPVTLIGIQPDPRSHGPSLTAAEQAAVARIVCTFQRLLGPRTSPRTKRGGKGR